MLRMPASTADGVSFGAVEDADEDRVPKYSGPRRLIRCVYKPEYDAWWVSMTRDC